MKPKLYGGLLLENVIAHDGWYERQLKLFNKGLIQGVQIRIGHPNFTPGLTISELINKLQILKNYGLELFIHIGSENMGVDLGETFDETGRYEKMGKQKDISWSSWNGETLRWARYSSVILEVGAVIHPGYSSSYLNQTARQRIKNSLPLLAEYKVAIENVPPLACKKSDLTWGLDGIWGVGGTPEEMEGLLKLHPSLKCLIDFTHLWVARNQAKELKFAELAGLRDINEAVKSYMSLRHSPVCHFSGLPPTLEDNHDHLLTEPVPAIHEALAQHEAICLEIPYNDGAQEQIIKFKKIYGF